MDIGTATLEDRLAISYKTKHALTIQSSDYAACYLPRGVETCVHTKMCTWMFIVVLFIIVRTLKQLQCPLVGEWINKVWYVHMMECYSGLKGNELSSQEKIQRNIK